MKTICILVTLHSIIRAYMGTVKWYTTHQRTTIWIWRSTEPSAMVSICIHLVLGIQTHFVHATTKSMLWTKRITLEYIYLIYHASKLFSSDAVFNLTWVFFFIQFKALLCHDCYSDNTELRYMSKLLVFFKKLFVIFAS